MGWLRIEAIGVGLVGPTPVDAIRRVSHADGRDSRRGYHMNRGPSAAGARREVPSLRAGPPEGSSEALLDLLRPGCEAVAAGDPPVFVLTASYPASTDGGRAVPFVPAALTSSRSPSWVELGVAERPDRCGDRLSDATALSGGDRVAARSLALGSPRR